MKKSFYILATLLVAMQMISCLKDSESTGSPECAITAFSVADIPCKRVITVNGVDSTIKVSMSGKDIYFNINQLSRQIYNVDSLPYWVTLTKVVPTVTCQGNVYVRADDEPFHSFNNGKDSIDFTQNIQFMVVAYDGVSKIIYDAKINLASNEADSLYWTEEENLAPMIGKHHNVACGNRLFVFHEVNGSPYVTSTNVDDKVRTWTTPQMLKGAAGTIDYTSVVYFKGYFYAIDNNNTLYCSLSENNATEWKQASSKRLKNLLATDGNYLYGYDELAIWATDDVEDWNIDCWDNLDQIPTKYTSYAYYASKTNPNFLNVVMMGWSPNLKKDATVWYKLSSYIPYTSQDWEYIHVNNDNTHEMPKLRDLQMVFYNGELMAFGGEKEGETSSSTAYEAIYTSSDNGITWHKQTKKLVLPKELLGYAGQATATVLNGRIWLVRDDGKVWSGAISKKSNRSVD